jgi:protein ImuB
MALVRARLEHCVLPEPVTELRLRSGPVLPLGFASGSLLHPQKSVPEAAGAVPRLVERLRARLGEEAVFGVCLVPEHRPEAAWRVAQLVANDPDSKDSRISGRALPKIIEPATTRPLWMLTQPEALEEAGGAPRYRGPLAIESGPERIETGWWDGKDVARDYYIARDRRGARLWIYQERRPPCGWFWHGIFG